MQQSEGVVSFRVKVNGAEVRGSQAHNIQSVEVERTFNRPDLCVVTFAAPEVSAEKTLPTYKPGDALTVEAVRASARPIFEGEVTSIELEGRSGTTIYVLRAYDRRHRMYRGTKSRTFLDMTASDVVSKIAREHGIPLEVASTSTVFPYLAQNALSDGDYVEQLMHEAGYVSVYENKKALYKPLHSFDTKVETLEFGRNLDSYTFRRTAESWVSKVEIRDWDVKTKKEVVGAATSPKSVLSSGDKANGNTLGGAALAYRSSVVDQRSATTAAQAAIDRALSFSRHLDGVSDGNESLAPGKVVEIKGIDATYNGKYRLSFVRHRWDAETGYVTDFSCNDPRESSLTSLLAGAASAGAGVDQVGNRILGVVSAIVTDTRDEENLARVKVAYPWMPADDGKQIESQWVRLALPAAGKDKGWFLIPEVGDEVLVAFEHGDVRRGYVVGGLYNGVDKPPLKTETSVKQGKTLQKMFRSSKGHQLTFNDSDQNPGVELTTPAKKLTMHLDDKNGSMTLTAAASGTTVKVTADGEITITSDNGGVTIEAKQDITMKATGSIKLEATQNVDIKGNMNVSVKAGSNATVEGTAKAAVTGAMVDVKAQGVATLGGAMVKIN